MLHALALAGLIVAGGELCPPLVGILWLVVRRHKKAPGFGGFGLYAIYITYFNSHIIVSYVGNMNNTRENISIIHIIWKILSNSHPMSTT